jgi:hypothetical protein
MKRVSGGLVVGPGETCVLDHVTVWGGVTVNGSGSTSAPTRGFIVSSSWAPR